MRAQWVCSRERRIALYKRSSINQSISSDSISCFMSLCQQWQHIMFFVYVSTLTAYHALCQQWQHIMFCNCVNNDSISCYLFMCQQWQHIMLCVNSDSISCSVCVNGDSILCSMSLCQQWQHIMFYVCVNNVNDSISCSVSLCQQWQHIVFYVSVSRMTAYHVLCLCVNNDSISCSVSLCQEWQHIMFCASVSTPTSLEITSVFHSSGRAGQSRDFTRLQYFTTSVQVYNCLRSVGGMEWWTGFDIPQILKYIHWIKVADFVFPDIFSFQSNSLPPLFLPV